MPDASVTQESYDVLAGVRVLEASMYAFAPSAAAVLADWGADVIKIVPPEVADPMRGNPIAGLPAPRVDIAFMWEITNRGKRCIGIDLAHPASRQVLAQLVRRSDVFITNLLPSARERFGVDVEQLMDINPRLIYGRASGHGPRGPEAHAGGFDHTDFWARTGIGHAASLVCDEFVPQAGPALGDLASGAFLAGAIAAALYRRERTGKGSVVDVSLLSTGMWMFSPAVVASGIYDVDTIPRLRHADLPNPLVAAYKTRDARLIYISGVQTEAHFTNLCNLIGRPDLIDDPRFATGKARAINAKECITILDDVFAARDLCEWRTILAAMTAPWTVVQTAREAARDPQVQANGFMANVEKGDHRYSLVSSPAQFDEIAPALRPAPEHGEHTDEVFGELGYSEDELIELKISGAVI